MDKLYIIIPAFNEEANIEAITHEWHEVVAGISEQSRLVVIDDGSKDGTYEKLLEMQKELPQLEAISKPNSGHGPTLLQGYRYALDKNADYVFQTDSDGQTLPSEFEPFWANRQDYDFQIGWRKKRQDGLSRVFVSKVLKVVLFLQFGLWTKDANTPFRLMSAESLKEIIALIPENHNLANVLMVVFYHKKKKRIKYRPITFRPRQGGENSINLKKIIKIGWAAVKSFGRLKK
jgi:glycosyltransferase involved in cell wall biosynthesis